MTKRSQEAKRKLMQDVESYTCGEVPNGLDLLRAAKLDHWYVCIRRRGKEFAMVLRGEVSRHPEIADGTSISTPAVMWFDRKSRFVRTTGRLYILGQPGGVDIPINEEGDA